MDWILVVTFAIIIAMLVLINYIVNERTRSSYDDDGDISDFANSEGVFVGVVMIMLIAVLIGMCRCLMYVMI